MRPHTDPAHNAEVVCDIEGPDVVIPESLAVYLLNRFIAADMLDELAAKALENYIVAAHGEA